MNKMSIKKIRFTKEGYEKLKEEKEKLLALRPAVVEDLKKARELGDLKENGYYKASKAKLSSIDSRLMHITYHLKMAVIVDDLDQDGIGIGSKVTLSNGKKDMRFQIVGDLEADPSQEKLSLLSPLGRALEGKKEGDSCTLELPGRKITYVIKSVS